MYSMYVCTRNPGDIGFCDMVLIVDAGKRLFAGERSASYVLYTKQSCTLLILSPRTESSNHEGVAAREFSS